MFNTQPEAEHKFLSAINPKGERCWQWIEIAIHAPLYLVSGDAEIEGVSLGRDWLFGQLRDVLSLMNTSKGALMNIEIGLLSPGYMNGSNSYQLGKIKEIWQHPDGTSKLFVLVDGTKLRYSASDESTNDQDMELVLSL